MLLDNLFVDRVNCSIKLLLAMMPSSLLSLGDKRQSGRIEYFQLLCNNNSQTECYIKLLYIVNNLVLFRDNE